MPKFDASVLRYLSAEDFRVLTAVEMGMKNHSLVPSDLIGSIAALRHGGVHRVLMNLLRHKLVAHDGKKYDGFKLTYAGYDYLALKALVKRGVITAVGNQIGVGKESDIFVAVGPAPPHTPQQHEGHDATTTTHGASPDKPSGARGGSGADGAAAEEGTAQLALKLHRLGRISFRAIKRTRDYFRSRSSASWLYLSRLAALKEFAFMKALSGAGFPVPRPVSHNRHCVLMSLVQGCQLNQVRVLRDAEKVYNDVMSLVVRLGRAGLVHCDFNEFNMLIGADETITLIDFPQMVSTSHPNARFYFSRDVECVRCFFRKRFGFEKDTFPTFDDVGAKGDGALDSQMLFPELPRGQQADLEVALASTRKGGGGVPATRGGPLRPKIGSAGIRKIITSEQHGKQKGKQRSSGGGGRNRNKKRGGGKR